MINDRRIVRILIYLVLVFLVGAGIVLLPGPKQEVVSSSEASVDLREYDLNDAVYILDAPWESWSEQLYDPSELDSAKAPQSSNELDYTNIDYATHRFTLRLQPDIPYGISFSAPKYAMRLYVDGEEAFSTGAVGTTREDTEPCEYAGVYYITPSSDRIEIVVHVANFVHREGGQPLDLVVGTQENITRQEREEDVESGLVTGCLVAAFLFHLGIYLLNRQQKASLLFALFCLLLAFQSSSFLPSLLQAYDWAFATKAEYLVNLGALIALILLIKRLFPHALSNWVYQFFISFCVLYGMLVVFTDSRAYTQALPFFQIFSIAFALYILVRLAWNLRERSLKSALAFLGMLLVGICGTGDVLIRNDLIPFGLVERQFFSIGTGAILLVFCYVLVLAIEQAEANKKAEDIRRALDQAEERYAKLIEEKQGTETLSDKLMEFGLTKREIEVASLLLNGKSREEIAALLFVSMGTVNTHCTNIYRKADCKSVGELAHCVNPDWFSQ